MHPARLQYSLFSDQNPFMAWTAQAAKSVSSTRRPVGDDNPFKVLEKQVSDGIAAWLDSWRELRDLTYEQVFFGVYGSELMQALLGLKSSGEERRRKTQPRHPAHAALVREKIRDLKQRIGAGGPREAAIRALVYVGLPEGRIDERAFGALKHMHEQAPKQERMTLAEFKQLFREQFFMLLLDEEEAMAALPRLLPEDREARKKIFDRVLTVTTAAGQPSETRRTRLRELAARLDLDVEHVLDRKMSKRKRKQKSKKQPEPPEALGRISWPRHPDPAA